MDLGQQQGQPAVWEALQVLGLHGSATPATLTREGLQAAYRRLASLWHPDKAPAGGRAAAEERMKAINGARERLEGWLSRPQGAGAAGGWQGASWAGLSAHSMHSGAPSGLDPRLSQLQQFLDSPLKRVTRAVKELAGLQSAHSGAALRFAFDNGGSGGGGGSREGSSSSSEASWEYVAASVADGMAAGSQGPSWRYLAPSGYLYASPPKPGCASQTELQQFAPMLDFLRGLQQRQGQQEQQQQAGGAGRQGGRLVHFCSAPAVEVAVLRSGTAGIARAAGTTGEGLGPAGRLAVSPKQILEKAYSWEALFPPEQLHASRGAAGKEAGSQGAMGGSGRGKRKPAAGIKRRPREGRSLFDDVAQEEEEDRCKQAAAEGRKPWLWRQLEELREQALPGLDVGAVMAGVDIRVPTLRSTYITRTKFDYEYRLPGMPGWARSFKKLEEWLVEQEGLEIEGAAPPAAAVPVPPPSCGMSEVGGAAVPAAAPQPEKREGPQGAAAQPCRLPCRAQLAG